MPLFNPPSGSGSQTPWTSDIDGDTYKLTNVDELEVINSIKGASLILKDASTNQNVTITVVDGQITLEV